MNVKEMREALDGLPDDLKIIMASDEEGNSYGELEDADLSFCYDDEHDGLRPVHPDDLDEYEEDELVQAVVLWP